MDDINPDFNLKIADVLLGFKSKSKNIALDSHISVDYFVESSSCSNTPDYIFFYYQITEFNDSELKPVFIGEPQDNEVLNYKWKVYQSNNEIVIAVFFENHEQIKVIYAELSPDDKKVNVKVQLQENLNEGVKIDPIIHPIGSLVLLYLMHWKNGLLIHASGVLFNNEAFLFTGVSGIGKSTMAKLWRNEGYLVLNDDRLVIRLVNGEVKLYNNPMPYYKQYPAEGILKKIFLLKQSPTNYIKPLIGAMAYSRVLANFIQQFYKPSMVKKHLEIIDEVMKNVKVYEVGFKPDKDIVSMITKMDG